MVMQLDATRGLLLFSTDDGGLLLSNHHRVRVLLSGECILYVDWLLLLLLLVTVQR